MDLPNPSNRILYDVPCAVCHDHSSGKHYGVFACDGCAGFFKRSVRRARNYSCKARAPGRCIMDKARRNQCRSCRFSKCLTAGMNRDAVQHERGPRNSTIRRQMGLLIKEAMPQNQAISLPAPMAPPLNVPLHPLMVPPEPSPLYHSPFFHRMQLFNTSTGFKMPLPFNIASRFFAPSSPEVLCEGAARLLFMNVKWAKNLPLFSYVNASDRILLIEETWKDLFVIGAAQFLHPIDLKLLIQNTCSGINMEEAAQFASVVKDLALLRPDTNEFACLRAIALFKTTIQDRTGDANARQTKRVQDPRSIFALQSQTLGVLIEWSALLDPSRPDVLLQFLPRIQEVSSSVIVELFFRPTIGNISIERILGDMYTERCEVV